MNFKTYSLTSNKSDINNYNKNSSKKTSHNHLEGNELPSNSNNNPGYTLFPALSEGEEEFIKEVLKNNNLVDEFDDDTINEFAIGFYSIQFEEDYVIYTEGSFYKDWHIQRTVGRKCSTSNSNTK